MLSEVALRAAVIIVPAVMAFLTGVVGYSGDWVGWAFCVIFSLVTAFIIAMMLYEQNFNFRSSLTKIDALDLTYVRDLPTADGRLRVRDHIFTQFAWLARHRN